MKRTLTLGVAITAIAFVFSCIGAAVILLLHRTSKPEIWIPALAAVTGAIVAPYVAEFLRANIFVADLIVECEPREPWYAATITNVTIGGQPVPLQVLDRGVSYYRLSITNRGVVQAECCEAALEQVWFEHENEWYRLAFWEPDGLAWTGDRTNPRTQVIQRDRRTFVDIGSVPTEAVLQYVKHNVARDWPDAKPSGPRFMLALRTGYASLPYALGPGHYVLDIGIYAANAEPKRVYIEIVFQPKDFREIRLGTFQGQGIDGVSVARVSAPPKTSKPVRSYQECLGVLTKGVAPLELE